MANNGNLKRGNPETQFKSGQQAVESGRKGGIASGEAKRRKRDAKEIIEIFLSMNINNGKKSDIEGIKNFMDIQGKTITVEEAMHLKMVQKALKGDLNAYNMALSIIGDKPAEKVKVEANVNPMAELTTEELRKLIEQHGGDK